MKIRINTNDGRSSNVDIPADSSLEELIAAVSNVFFIPPTLRPQIRLQTAGTRRRVDLVDQKAKLSELGVGDRSVVAFVNVDQLCDKVSYKGALVLDSLLKQRSSSEVSKAVLTSLQKILKGILSQPRDIAARRVDTTEVINLFRQADCFDLISALGFIRRGDVLELNVKDEEHDLEFARYTLKQIEQESGEYDEKSNIYEKKSASQEEKKEIKTSESPITIRVHSEDGRSADIKVTGSLTIEKLRPLIAKAFFLPSYKVQSMKLQLVNRKQNYGSGQRVDLDNLNATLDSYGINERSTLVVPNCATLSDKIFYSGGYLLDRLIEKRKNLHEAVALTDYLRDFLTKVLKDPTDSVTRKVEKVESVVSLFRQCDALELLNVLGFVRRADQLELPISSHNDFLRYVLRTIHQELGTFDPSDPLYNDIEEDKKEETEESSEDKPTLETLDERVKKKIEEQGGLRKYQISEVREKEAKRKVRDISSYTGSIFLLLFLFFFCKVAIYDRYIARSVFSPQALFPIQQPIPPFQAPAQDDPHLIKNEEVTTKVVPLQTKDIQDRDPLPTAQIRETNVVSKGEIEKFSTEENPEISVSIPSVPTQPSSSASRSTPEEQT